MYVTPDLSGVVNEILGAAAQRRSGAAAQLLGAQIDILGAA